MSVTEYKDKEQFSGVIKSQRMTTTKTGDPLFLLQVELKSRLKKPWNPDPGADPAVDDPEEKTVFLNLGMGQIERSLGELVALGFDSDDVSLLDPNNPDEDVLDLTGKSCLVSHSKGKQDGRSFWNLWHVKDTRHEVKSWAQNNREVVRGYLNSLKQQSAEPQTSDIPF